jgi:AMP-binding enzyme
MILKGDGAAAGSEATLDSLFRRAGVRAPQNAALCDPLNRVRFTDGVPRGLDYAQTDRAITALAARLRGLGLATDTVVAIQLPNIVEAVIALLGVLRAGMIAAPLPLLWQQQDMVEALRGIGAKAILTCARIGDHRPAQTAMLAAADLFPIRHIAAFGSDLPDGVVPLDGERASATGDFKGAPPRPGPAGDHVAVITFDVTAQGITPVARNHAQLIAGGLAACHESGLGADAALLSAIPPASFAGIALSVVPWLLAGNSLTLHQGCDVETLAAQSAALKAATLVLPGPALAALVASGKIAASVKSILALWRAPERLGATAWREPSTLVDVASFGEIGLLASRRGADGLPAPIPLGFIGAPHAVGGEIAAMQTARSRSGTLLLRGPMVPAHAYASMSETGTGAAEPAGFVDTGFACRRDGERLILTAPPAGLALVGGYRFQRRTLDAQLLGMDPGATIVALPDALLGERLAGGELQAAAAALRARGANPLISGAFAPRRAAPAA